MVQTKFLFLKQLISAFDGIIKSQYSNHSNIGQFHKKQMFILIKMLIS